MLTTTRFRFRFVAIGIALCFLFFLTSVSVAYSSNQFPSIPGKTRLERWNFVQSNIHNFIGADSKALGKLLGNEAKRTPDRYIQHVESSSYMLSEDPKTRDCEILSFIFCDGKVAKLEISMGRFIDVH